MTPTFRYAALTDVGTVRVNNEDAALATPSLLALADGMGGHAAGEVASAVVMHSLTRLALGEAELTPEALTGAAREARGALRSMSLADAEMEGMGTTLVALAVGPDGVSLVHVGDSRIYRMRAGVLTQLTTDHTHVQRLVESGRLAPEEVRTHPYRSVILRSIDDSSDDLPDVDLTDEVLPGDRVLLCSDGLSDYLVEDSIASALTHGSVEDAAANLVRDALRAGTRDNVTVVVADVLADEPGEGGGETNDGGAAVGRSAGTRASREPQSAGATLAEVALAPEAAVALEAALAGTVEPAAGGAEGAAGSEAAQESEVIAETAEVVVTAETPENAVAADPLDRGDAVADPAPVGAAPLLSEASSAVVPEGVLEPEPDHRPGDGPDPEDGRAPTPGAPETAAPQRATAREIAWLALVLATFAATTIVVWLTSS